jgi:hypothetical protein
LQSFFYKCDYNGKKLGQILRFCEQKATLTIMNIVEGKKKKNQLFSVDKQKYANLTRKYNFLN